LSDRSRRIGEDVQAGIHLADRPLVGRRVPSLDDARDPTGSVPHYAAVRTRSRRSKGNQRGSRIRLLTKSAKVQKCLRPDQGDVSGQDQNRAFRQFGHLFECYLRGVSGAHLGLLGDEGEIGRTGQGRPHRIRLMSDDHHRARLELAAAVKHIVENGPARRHVQHFGKC